MYKWPLKRHNTCSILERKQLCPVHDWPLISIHIALTPDGRVLTYGTDGTGKQTGYFIYDVWDPSAGLEALRHQLVDESDRPVRAADMVVLAGPIEQADGNLGQVG